MASVNKIVVATDGLGKDFNLSPEYWLSAYQASAMQEGILVETLVTITRQGRTATSGDTLVLDTGHAEGGFLNLRFDRTGGKERVSQKKIVPEGSVIISRLRPYLRQVAYVPVGLEKRLGVKQILASTEFYILRPIKEESIAYLTAWLLSTQVQKVLNDAATGGHHPRFDEEILMRMSVPNVLYKTRGKLSAEIQKLVDQHIDSQIGMAKLFKV